MVWDDDRFAFCGGGWFLFDAAPDGPKLWRRQQRPAMGVLALSAVAGLYLADGGLAGTVKAWAVFLFGTVSGERYFGFLVQPQSLGASLALPDMAARITAVNGVFVGRIRARFTSFSLFAVSRAAKSRCRNSNKACTFSAQQPESCFN